MDMCGAVLDKVRSEATWCRIIDGLDYKPVAVLYSQMGVYGSRSEEQTDYSFFSLASSFAFLTRCISAFALTSLNE